MSGKGATQLAIAGRPAQIRQFMIRNRYDRKWPNGGGRYDNRRNHQHSNSTH
jgi:hypothetical protein